MQHTESRVLIVADETQRELLAAIVARTGCSSVAVSAGAEALELLGQESFELMLLDTIADIPALELLAKLDKAGSAASMSVLLLTASGDAQERTRAPQGGTLEVLVKPFDPLELACKVRILVELALLHSEQRGQGAQLTKQKAIENQLAQPERMDSVSVLAKVAPAEAVGCGEDVLVASALATCAASEQTESLRALPPPLSDVVLVIEDNEGVQLALSRVLTSAGFTPELVASRRAAREVLETKPEPSIVLCDLTLSDGSAIELLEWLQATRPSLCERVFLLTGGPVSSSSQQRVTGGSFRVLSKLTAPAQLLRILNEARQLYLDADQHSARPPRR